MGNSTPDAVSVTLFLCLHKTDFNHFDFFNGILEEFLFSNEVLIFKWSFDLTDELIEKSMNIIKRISIASKKKSVTEATLIVDIENIFSDDGKWKH